jgi:hypothetical protein
MRPQVIDELENDLVCFGNCVYSVLDDVDEFSIRREDLRRVYIHEELF